MMRLLVIALAVALAGCAGTPVAGNLGALAEFTQQDVDTACRISREWGDKTGERCFCALSGKEIIAPTGLVSTLAASRVKQFARPPECAQVILDAQHQAARLGL